MKNIKLYKIITLLVVMIFSFSCVKDEDFNEPDLTIEEPTVGNVISMNAITGQLLNNNLSNFFIDEYIDLFDDRNDILPITFESTNNFIEGYVISNDEGGNFFEEMVIQNSLEDPSFGIVIQADVNPLFTRFELGRKVFIKLDGLSFSISNGVLTLGILNSNGRIEKISESQLNEFVLRSTEIGIITPKLINLAEQNLVLSTNQFVTVEDVQFHRSLILGDNGPVTFANEVSDEFNGERLLESCIDGDIIVSTSTFADFNANKLPVNRGIINGVLTRNFFGDELNLVINSPSDIHFDNDERCDPLFFNFDFETLVCARATTGGTALISENFESFSSSSIEENGWSQHNLVEGDTNWVLGNFSGNSYAQITGFNSDELDIDVLLVSPTVNFDSSTDEKLNFDIQVNYDNGNILKVLVSNDYTDNIFTATWSDLNVTIPTGPSGGFGSFESVGPVDVSCIDGDVTIAFLYEGSDPGNTTRYHIDNFEIIGN